MASPPTKHLNSQISRTEEVDVQDIILKKQSQSEVIEANPSEKNSSEPNLKKLKPSISPKSNKEPGASQFEDCFTTRARVYSSSLVKIPYPVQNIRKKSSPTNHPESSSCSSIMRIGSQSWAQQAEKGIQSPMTESSAANVGNEEENGRGYQNLSQFVQNKFIKRSGKQSTFANCQDSIVETVEDVKSEEEKQPITKIDNSIDTNLSLRYQEAMLSSQLLKEYPGSVPLDNSNFMRQADLIELKNISSTTQVLGPFSPQEQSPYLRIPNKAIPRISKGMSQSGPRFSNLVNLQQSKSSPSRSHFSEQQILNGMNEQQRSSGKSKITMQTRGNSPFSNIPALSDNSNNNREEEEFSLGSSPTNKAQKLPSFEPICRQPSDVIERIKRLTDEEPDHELAQLAADQVDQSGLSISQLQAEIKSMEQDCEVLLDRIQEQKRIPHISIGSASSQGFSQKNQKQLMFQQFKDEVQKVKHLLFHKQLALKLQRVQAARNQLKKIFERIQQGVVVSVVYSACLGLLLTIALVILIVQQNQQSIIHCALNLAWIIVLFFFLLLNARKVRSLILEDIESKEFNKAAAIHCILSVGGSTWFYSQSQASALVKALQNPTLLSQTLTVIQFSQVFTVSITILTLAQFGSSGENQTTKMLSQIAPLIFLMMGQLNYQAFQQTIISIIEDNASNSLIVVDMVYVISVIVFVLFLLSSRGTIEKHFEVDLDVEVSGLEHLSLQIIPTFFEPRKSHQSRMSIEEKTPKFLFLKDKEQESEESTPRQPKIQQRMAEEGDIDKQILVRQGSLQKSELEINSSFQFQKQESLYGQRERMEDFDYFFLLQGVMVFQASYQAVDQKQKVNKQMSDVKNSYKQNIRHSSSLRGIRRKQSAQTMKNFSVDVLKISPNFFEKLNKVLPLKKQQSQLLDRESSFEATFKKSKTPQSKKRHSSKRNNNSFQDFSVPESRRMTDDRVVSFKNIKCMHTFFRNPSESQPRKVFQSKYFGQFEGANSPLSESVCMLNLKSQDQEQIEQNKDKMYSKIFEPYLISNWTVMLFQREQLAEEKKGKSFKLSIIDIIEHFFASGQQYMKLYFKVDGQKAKWSTMRKKTSRLPMPTQKPSFRRRQSQDCNLIGGKNDQYKKKITKTPNLEEIMEQKHENMVCSKKTDQKFKKQLSLPRRAKSASSSIDSHSISDSNSETSSLLTSEISSSEAEEDDCLSMKYSEYEERQFSSDPDVIYFEIELSAIGYPQEQQTDNKSLLGDDKLLSIINLRDITNLINNFRKQNDKVYLEAIEMNYSHELKNPLNIVLIGSDLLQKQLGKMYEDVSRKPYGASSFGHYIGTPSSMHRPSTSTLRNKLGSESQYTTDLYSADKLKKMLNCVKGIDISGRKVLMFNDNLITKMNIQKNQVTFNRKWILRPEKLLKEIIELFDIQIMEHKLSVYIVRLNDFKGSWIEADWKYYKLVLFNIVQNAVKYNHYKGDLVIMLSCKRCKEARPPISQLLNKEKRFTQLRDSQESEPNFELVHEKRAPSESQPLSTLVEQQDTYVLETEIVNTGEGISDARQKMLFIPFSELSRAGSICQVKNFNIGLGLSCSQAIVQYLGGDIRVKISQSGITNFGFKIPVKVKISEKNSSSSSCLTKAKYTPVFQFVHGEFKKDFTEPTKKYLTQRQIDISTTQRRDKNAQQSRLRFQDQKGKARTMLVEKNQVIKAPTPQDKMNESLKSIRSPRNWMSMQNIPNFGVQNKIKQLDNKIRSFKSVDTFGKGSKKQVSSQSLSQQILNKQKSNISPSSCQTFNQDSRSFPNPTHGKLSTPNAAFMHASDAGNLGKNIKLQCSGGKKRRSEFVSNIQDEESKQSERSQSFQIYSNQETALQLRRGAYSRTDFDCPRQMIIIDKISLPSENKLPQDKVQSVGNVNNQLSMNFNFRSQLSVSQAGCSSFLGNKNNGNIAYSDNEYEEFNFQDNDMMRSPSVGYHRYSVPVLQKSRSSERDLDSGEFDIESSQISQNRGVERCFQIQLLNKKSSKRIRAQLNPLLPMLNSYSEGEDPGELSSEKEISKGRQEGVKLDFSQLDGQKCCPPSILIAEDEQFSAMFLSQMIEQEFQITPEIAYNGADAVEMFKQRAQRECQCKEKMFRLVISDINMPVMDGLQAAREINAIIDIQSSLKEQPQEELKEELKEDLNLPSDQHDPLLLRVNSKLPIQPMLSYSQPGSPPASHVGRSAEVSDIRLEDSVRQRDDTTCDYKPHIVGLSAYSQKAQCLEVGMMDLYNKPLDHKLMCQMIYRHFYRLSEDELAEKMRHNMSQGSVWSQNN